MYSASEFLERLEEVLVGLAQLHARPASTRRAGVSVSVSVS